MRKQFPRINFYADETDFVEVKNALNENKNIRMQTRYIAILNYLQGYTQNEIASMLNISSQTVGTYIKKYKLKGLAGLNMAKSPGATPHLNKDQEAELVDIILTKTPDQLGFTARKNWDTTILRQFVLKFYGVSYSQRGMLEVLYRNNLSYTRPTYSLAKANLSKQEEFKENFELLKKI